MKQQEKIDAYLLGMLSKQEEENFLEEIRKDKALAEEVAASKELILGIKAEGRDELKATLDTIHDTLQPQADPIQRSLIRRLSPWLAAAAVLFLVALFWFQSSPSSFQEIYAANYSPYELRLSQRDKNETDIATANTLYRQAKYQEALPIFQKLITAQPQQSQYRMGLAICYLQTQQNNLAKQELRTIYDSGDIFLKEQAAWYLGLIALSENRPADARSFWTLLAENPQADHHQDAQKILNQIKDR